MGVEHASATAGRDQVSYTVSSGNVFADLDVDQPTESLLKADLALEIGRIISERGLTQTAAARVLGVDQPKVSALLRGRLTGFSIDRLIRFAIALGQDVEIVVHPREHDGPARDVQPAGAAANPEPIAAPRIGVAAR